MRTDVFIHSIPKSWIITWHRRLESGDRWNLINYLHILQTQHGEGGVRKTEAEPVADKHILRIEVSIIDLKLVFEICLPRIGLVELTAVIGSPL